MEIRDSGSPNFTEFSVAAIPNSKTKLTKLLIYLGALLLFFVYFYVIWNWARPFFATFPVVLILLAVAVWFFMRYTNLEYEYVIMSGEFHMSVIYGGRKRKELFCVRISEMERIADCVGGSAPEAEKAQKVYFCASSREAENLCYALFRSNEGFNCAVYFEATKKALSIMKFYNSSAYAVSKR